MLAGLEMMEYGPGLKKGKIEKEGRVDLSGEELDELERWTKSIIHGRAQLGKMEQWERIFARKIDEGRKAGRDAWIEVDRVLDGVWMEAGS